MHATALDISDAEVRARSERLVARLSDEDPSLWSAAADQQAEIANLLGWIRIAERIEPEARAISQWAAEVSAEIDDVVLLGMGGSSLAPEVMAAMLPPAAGRPRLTVLDSTDPATVRRVSGAIDLERTLFIVASKSGGTLETAVLYATFRAQYADRNLSDAGSHFIAITDPDTSLARRASDEGFARTFLNDSRIGGRYSALSYFGLVPTALVGLDVASVLAGAVEFGREALQETNIEQNSAIRLGLALGVLAQRGRDKLTLALSARTQPLGAWIEQLIAESTGKQGYGIVPVDGETLGDPSVYGDDRVFVGVSVADEPIGGLDALAEAGHPVIRLTMDDVHDLGAEFLRWELATAVAGWVFGINPFDQPNVEESKANTARVLGGAPLAEDGGRPTAGTALRVAGASGTTAAEAVMKFLGDTARDDYVSIHAYLDRTPAHEARLRQIQTSIRDRRGRAITLGFGPRFLHSTGQLHKGGPNRGVFMQITCDHRDDVPIPGEAYGFAALIDAQAEGDLQSLRDKERRVLRLVAREPESGLCELVAIAETLSMSATQDMAPATAAVASDGLPARDGHDAPKSSDPQAFVIFGGSGDLAARKLIPALYNLRRDGLLPDRFVVAGQGRRPMDDEIYRARLLEAASRYSRSGPPQPESWNGFAERLALPPRRLQRCRGFRSPERRAPAPRGGARHRRQPHLLPRHPAQPVPRGHQAPRRVRADPGTRNMPHRHREAVRPRSRIRRRAARHRQQRLRRVPDLSHRSLSG